MISAIVVTAGRRPDLLRICLLSLLRQPAGLLADIVLVDDSVAQDVNLDAVGSALRAGRVSCLHTGGGAGPAVARNRGAEVATRDHLWFVDDDARPWPGAAAAFGRAAREHPGSVLGGHIRPLCVARPPRTCAQCTVDYALVAEDQEVDPDLVWACNMVVPRSVFVAVGGFPSGAAIYGEEYELLRRLAAAGSSIRQASGAGVDHLRSADDLSLRALIARRWVRGRNQIANQRTFGWDRWTSGGELAQMARELRHGYRHACVGGVLRATESAARLAALRRGDRR